MSPARRAAFVVLFVFSGLCGLGYEVLWLRLVAGIVGVGIYANAIVLATFMLGLGLGALAAGRWLPGLSRPQLLRTYVWIELALGAWALLIPLLAWGLDAAMLGVTGPIGRGVLAMVAIALVLLPATTLMGATLPLLTSALGEAGRSGRWLGLLYGVNTLGALAGTVLAGLVLIPGLGLTRTSLVLVACNWMVAGAAKRLGAGVDDADPGAKDEPPQPREGRLVPAELAALLAVAALGLLGIGQELMWMRALAAYARDTVSTLVLTLAAVLLGLALGGLVGAVLVPAQRKASGSLSRIAMVSAFAVLAVLAGPWALRELVARPGALALDTGFGLAMVALALVPAALASGAVLPLATAVLAGRRGPARASAAVLVASTVGSVGGALALGLWWVPSWGTLGATHLLVAAVVAAALALAGVALRSEPGRASLVELLVALGLLAGSAALPDLPSSPHMPARDGADPSELVFAREDAVGLAEVLERGGHKRLVTDRSHAWGSDEPVMLRAMRRQGYLPMLLHPAPARVLELGLATGVQFAPYLRHPSFERGLIVEISPAVAAAAREFDEVADHVLDDPRVELAITDGRAAVRASEDGAWDLIVLGLFTAYRPGVSELYSADLYRVALAKLAPGGLLVQWLPLDQLSTEALAAILRSFRAAAPEVHAFEKDHYLALVGGREPLRVDWAKVEALVAEPEVAADLRANGLLDPYGMLGSHLADGPALDALVGPGPLNTDDRPYVEFHPPPAQASGSYGQASRSLEALLEDPVAATTIVRGLDEAQHQRLVDAGQARIEFLRGAIAQVRGDDAGAARHFTASTRLNPDDPMARMAARQALRRRRRPPGGRVD